MGRNYDDVVQAGLWWAMYCTLSPHEWTWTNDQSLDMARACCALAERLAAVVAAGKKLVLATDALQCAGPDTKTKQWARREITAFDRAINGEVALITHRR